MAYLMTLNGLEAGKCHELADGKNILGRHPACDLVIEESGASRRHCRIIIGDDCVLEDLDSRNGTLLNGVPLSGPAILRNGDKIQICNLAFSLRSIVGGDSIETQQLDESLCLVVEKAKTGEDEAINAI